MEYWKRNQVQFRSNTPTLHHSNIPLHYSITPIHQAITPSLQYSRNLGYFFLQLFDKGFDIGFGLLV